MALTPALQTTTADMAISYTVDPASGRLLVDIGQTPAGDLRLVTGAAKLVQSVTRWLLTPQGGNPVDPSYGNPLFGLLGRPMPPDFSAIRAMAEQADQEFLSRQQQEAALGYLTQDEMVSAFLNTTVGLYATAAGQIVPGMLNVSFTIQAKSGALTPVQLPFNVSLS